MVLFYIVCPHCKAEACWEDVHAEAHRRIAAKDGTPALVPCGRCFRVLVVREGTVGNCEPAPLDLEMALHMQIDVEAAQAATNALGLPGVAEIRGPRPKS